jgi:hypothetical protein
LIGAAELEPVATDVRAALTRLLSLVETAGPGQVRIAGVPVDLTVTPGEAALDDIARTLYAAWYTRPPDGRPSPATGLEWRADLVALLRAAHASAERFEDGWVVAAAYPDGRCRAARDESWRLVRPGEYLNLARPGVPPAPGEPAAVVARTDWVDEPTGFWFTGAPPEGPSPPLARAYLNVRADAVPRVLHALTAELADAELPYIVKCPRTVDGYARVDSLIVYHERRRSNALRAVLASMAGLLRGCLDPATPPLTERVAPGVSFADDPAGHKSFGEQRCAALAVGLVDAAQAGNLGGAAALAHLLAALKRAGVDPAQPWRDAAAPPEPGP